jgi:hypothetical protein
MVLEQTLDLIRVILNENNFQYNDKHFRPTKGIAMDSPISSIIVEIYFQLFEELPIRHSLESGEISY